MSSLVVTLHTQHARDERGRFHAHQWAEIPDDLAVVYMTGGLKRVRRMVEAYTRFESAPETARWVRGAWRRGQPVLCLRYFGTTLLMLDRLRQSGTIDAYRGHLDVLGGRLVPPDAIATPLPWPDDLPWAAPSAGEFDIQAEQERPPYLGIVEFRIYRRPSGCSAHVFVRDLPVRRTGFMAWLWRHSWMPLQSQANLAFLRADVQTAAQEQKLSVQFETREHDGVPAPLPPIRPLQETFSSLGPGPGAT